MSSISAHAKYWQLTAVLIGLSCSAGLAHAKAVGGSESDSVFFSTAEFRPYDGSKITAIRVHGLIHTHERAVRWLLNGAEGSLFSSDAWVEGIKKLYDTSVLYEVRTEIKEVGTPKEQKIEIDLYLREKWTILPFGSAQGGGGASTLGGGIFDTNLGGYFTNLSAGIVFTEGILGYDINLYQEWFLDTSLSLGLDASRIINSVTVQDRQGSELQNFTWLRTQGQALFGIRGGESIRTFAFFEIFKDRLNTASPGASVQVYSQTQYRIRPTLILGRSHFTNYLEEGSELTFAPTFANFANRGLSYSQFLISYKKTAILPHEANLAFLAIGGVMSPAPLPYQFRLGGFDSVRGFTVNRFIGNKYLNSTLEYRPTLYDHRFSAFDLDRLILQGALFVDAGWIKGDVSSLGMLSAGAGLRLIAEKFSNAIMRLDFGETLTPREGYDISFGVGQQF